MPASSGVRWLGFELRGRACAARTRAPRSRPARRSSPARAGCSTGSRIATGFCTLVWPPSEGSRASANERDGEREQLGRERGARGGERRGAGGASVATRAAAAGVPSVRVPPGPKARAPGLARSGRSASTASTTSQAAAPMPQARPKRVPSTSLTTSGLAAAQNVPPWPTAPCRITAIAAETKPTSAATSSSRSSRRVKARRGAAPAVQEEDQRAEAERDRGVLEAAREGQRGVRRPGRCRCRPAASRATRAGAVESPTEKTKPEEIACPSAETTR